ncbi:MAG: hypothetical protein AAGA46_15320 [Cyanobacteria bacterium P01_F01_bin.13]
MASATPMMAGKLVVETTPKAESLTRRSSDMALSVELARAEESTGIICLK